MRKRKPTFSLIEMTPRTLDVTSVINDFQQLKTIGTDVKVDIVTTRFNVSASIFIPSKCRIRTQKGIERFYPERA